PYGQQLQQQQDAYQPYGQPQDNSSVPARQSSFVGIPPVRRTSTFDVNALIKGKRSAAEDDNKSDAPSHADQNAAGPSTFQSQPPIAGQIPAQQQFAPTSQPQGHVTQGGFQPQGQPAQ